MKVNHEVLNNGFNLITVDIKDSKTTSFRISFPAGSRHEQASENGYAHFLEHLVFKGGEKFDSTNAIDWRAEELGTIFNASTGDEHVTFYITGRPNELKEMSELLLDFVINPTIPEEELDKERGVVIQEIAMYKDMPDSRVYELLNKATYGSDHPLGRDVIGTVESIENVSREEIIAFRDRTWSLEEGAIVVAGSIPEEALDFIRAEASNIKLAPNAPEPEAATPSLNKVIVSNEDTEQSHLMMSYEVSKNTHEDKDVGDLALSIVNRVLGVGLGSRLGSEIREKRGLCYSVRSDVYSLSDADSLIVSGGLQTESCVEAHKLIKDIVRGVATNGITEVEFKRAKAGIGGSLVRSLESSSAVASMVANTFVSENKRVINPDDLIDALERVTYQDVQAAAKRVNANECAVACIGDHSEDDFS